MHLTILSVVAQTATHDYTWLLAAAIPLALLAAQKKQKEEKIWVSEKVAIKNCYKKSKLEGK